MKARNRKEYAEKQRRKAAFFARQNKPQARSVLGDPTIGAGAGKCFVSKGPFPKEKRRSVGRPSGPLAAFLRMFGL